MSAGDPVVRLLTDLDRPVGPATEFRDALLARLLAELEDAKRDEQHASVHSNGRRGRLLRAVTSRPRRTMLVLAAVTGAAASALFVSSPWKTAPGFLEQVNAAITPPDAGSVLHVRLVMTAKRWCTVTQPPVEWWADLAPPHNYREIDVLADEDLCKPGISIERGGEPASRKALVFLPPNTLAISQMYAWELDTDPDPLSVRQLRQAIDAGTAHVEGETVIDGSAVTRIRVDCNQEQRANLTPCDPIYVYVDPETYRPVRSLSGPGIRPGPGGSCTAECYVQDFETYEYLPGTRANRALADIRAQHPDAKETTLTPGREPDEIRARYRDATAP